MMVCVCDLGGEEKDEEEGRKCLKAIAEPVNYDLIVYVKDTYQTYTHTTHLSFPIYLSIYIFYILTLLSLSVILVLFYV